MRRSAMVRALSRERARVVRDERDVTIVAPVREIGGRQPDALRERPVRLIPASASPPSTGHRTERAHLSQRELGPGRSAASSSTSAPRGACARGTARAREWPDVRIGFEHGPAQPRNSARTSAQRPPISKPDPYIPRTPRSKPLSRMRAGAPERAAARRRATGGRAALREMRSLGVAVARARRARSGDRGGRGARGASGVRRCVAFRRD